MDSLKKVNKYLYGWKFYVNYGQGWEYEIFEETRAGMVENRKAYRENCQYPLKITRGRELNPDWVTNYSCPYKKQAEASGNVCQCDACTKLRKAGIV